MQRRASLGRERILLPLGLALLAVAASVSSSAGAATTTLTPGAVFTQNNQVDNKVVAFNRAANGLLTPAGMFDTGGQGRPVSNPPAFTGFTVLDSMGSVNLSDDGDNKSCLFVVNAGSNDVSSFRVGPSGLRLADLESSGGTRPASVTSTTRGRNKQIMYVLNSDNTSASVRGFTVSGSCELTHIPGSDRALPSQASVPATIRFDEHGHFLAVSERYSPAQPVGNGDIVVFRVATSGLLLSQAVNPPDNRTPYGLDYNHKSDSILSVTYEAVDAPPFPNSTVATYRQNDDGTLTLLDQESSPGAAGWNLFTENSRFLFVSTLAGKFLSPASANVLAFTVDRDGQMNRVDAENTAFEAIDNALSHDDQFLYVLSANVFTPGTQSAINAFEIDEETGNLTPIDEEVLPGNSTSGLAAW